MHRFSWLVVAVVVAIVAGVAVVLASRDTDHVTSVVTPHAKADVDHTRRPNETDARSVRTTDDDLSDVSARVPEFGGYFVEAGVLQVWLTHPTPERGKRAAAALVETLGKDAVAGSSGTPVLRTAAFPFSDLRKWHERASARVLGLPGTVFTDIDEARNHLVVGISRTDAERVVRDHYRAVGAPADALRVERAEPPRPLSDLSEPHPGMLGGLGLGAVSPDGAQVQGCTLGLTVARKGKPGLLTNSHCTYKLAQLEGTPFYQPAPSHPGCKGDLVGSGPARKCPKIAVETVDPPGSSSLPGCPSGAICRYSDAAFAEYRSAVQSVKGAIAHPLSNGTATWEGTGLRRVVKETRPRAKQQVSKVGYVTGRTTGLVTKTCVNAAHDEKKTFILLCQSLSELPAQHGDSGAAVYADLDNAKTSVALVGIMWGSGGSFSPMYLVEQELGSLDSCWNLAC